jgi:UDP-N-acetylglucosamine--N-acetylmuramyl-(pentapeptide) pyrophosphoryl-undecaprenol N-acetylglucosamine transferase
MSKDKIILAAGGTGGHMFPASALAAELQNEGYEVHLLTDKRGMAFVTQLTAMDVHQIPAATVYSGGIFALPLRFITLFLTLSLSMVKILRLQPKVIIGFGGYPSFGPVMGGLLLRRKVLVHEQNAVLGRVNKLAARLGSSVATSYTNTVSVPVKAAERLRKTGNPLRPAVLKAAQGGYRFLSRTRPFDLLVFGGSQGAKLFSDIVPQAIALLSETQRKRLRIVHQVRKEDMRQALDTYSSLGVYAEIRDFFQDMPVRMRRAHLVIGRGGASTLAELAALGCPAIIVPLASSLDQDQSHNARELAEAGGAIMAKQSELTPASLAELIEPLMGNENNLQSMSERARKFGELDAVGRLSRYAVCLARNVPVQIEAPKVKKEAANG